MQIVELWVVMNEYCIYEMIMILGLIVFFTPVIYVISGFRPYKIFGLICILVNFFFPEYPPPPSNSANSLTWR